MTSICGWMGYSGDRGALERLIRAMGRRMDRPRAGESRIILGTCSALCINGVEPASHLCERDGVLAAVSGHFKWTNSDLATVAEQHGAAIALLQGFDRFGPNVVTYLSGAFNAAVVCEPGNQVLVATDRAGANPIAYAEAGDALIFDELGSYTNAAHEFRALLDWSHAFGFEFEVLGATTRYLQLAIRLV